MIRFKRNKTYLVPTFAILTRASLPGASTASRWRANRRRAARRRSLSLSSCSEPESEIPLSDNEPSVLWRDVVDARVVVLESPRTTGPCAKTWWTVNTAMTTYQLLTAYKVGQNKTCIAANLLSIVGPTHTHNHIYSPKPNTEPPSLTSLPWKSVNRNSLLYSISIYSHPDYTATNCGNKQWRYIDVWLCTSYIYKCIKSVRSDQLATKLTSRISHSWVDGRFPYSIKINLTLFMPRKHTGDILLYSLLTSTPDGNDCLTSLPNRFTPRERKPVTNLW